MIVWLPGGIFRFIHGILRYWLRGHRACLRSTLYTGMVTGTFCRGRCPHRPVRYDIRMRICSGGIIETENFCRGAFRAPAPFNHVAGKIRGFAPAPHKGSALDLPEALPLDSGKGHSPLQPNPRAYSVQKTYSACAQRYIRVWLPEHSVGGDAHIAPLIYLTFPIRRGAFRAPANSKTATVKQSP